VVVWDPIGGPIAVSVAELLAPDRSVAFVTQDLIVGTQLSRSGDLADASTRLQQAGVVLHKRSRLRRVTATAVTVEDAFTGETREIAAAVVVDGGHRLPDDGLWRDRPELPRAGDAVAPRTIYEAVLEGRRAALALDAGAA
jgi:2,4-dienoyl-CoA reductase (NADPH2)